MMSWMPGNSARGPHLPGNRCREMPEGLVRPNGLLFRPSLASLVHLVPIFAFTCPTFGGP